MNVCDDTHVDKRDRTISIHDSIQMATLVGRHYKRMKELKGNKIDADIIGILSIEFVIDFSI